MYNTHPGYQTSICDKNRAYYIRIFTVFLLYSTCYISNISVGVIFAITVKFEAILVIL